MATWYSLVAPPLATRLVSTQHCARVLISKESVFVIGYFKFNKTGVHQCSLSCILSSYIGKDTTLQKKPSIARGVPLHYNR